MSPKYADYANNVLLTSSDYMNECAGEQPSSNISAFESCDQVHITLAQLFYSWCPLHRDSAEILRFAAETCLLMSTTNHFISLSHGETVNGNRLSGENQHDDEIC